MGKQMNYDDYAEKYAQTRWAVPWIVHPLLREVRRISPHSTVVEIGCGTGNYIVAVSQELPSYIYRGFDLSEEMLKVACARSQAVEFTRGNADVRFPYPNQSCELAFCVDVIHHITDLSAFFQEASRILKSGGRLLIVTDSEDNIRRRSLTRYFPETLEVELTCYAKAEELGSSAVQSGLAYLGMEPAEGVIDLDAEFVAKLEQRCSSSMRLISEEAHRKGIERVRLAQKQGERWISCYTIFRYEKR
jgi:ubiquinone/menaquinone biosynthesis C-methylase UbiE